MHRIAVEVHQRTAAQLGNVPDRHRVERNMHGKFCSNRLDGPQPAGLCNLGDPRAQGMITIAKRLDQTFASMLGRRENP